MRHFSQNLAKQHFSKENNTTIMYTYHHHTGMEIYFTNLSETVIRPTMSPNEQLNYYLLQVDIFGFG